jgi:hypothetical protein
MKHSAIDETNTRVDMLLAWKAHGMYTLAGYILGFLSPSKPGLLTCKPSNYLKKDSERNDPL